MGKLSEFLSGTKVLEELESPINGKITVIDSIAFGKYIQVGGLTQSGGIIKNIWNTTLKKVSKSSPEVSKVLVLGLGGGSIINVIKKYWEDANITAIDIDEVMVKLGKKYLDLNGQGIEIEIGDAGDIVKSKSKNQSSKFDLICTDLYIGDQFPEKFETKVFAGLIKKLLSVRGVAVFNRLYYGEKRPQSVKFGKMLESVFPKVEVIYPEANVMFVCFQS